MKPSLIGICLASKFVSATPFTLNTDYTSSPTTFFLGFDFFTGPDPTDGFVKYVSSTAAAAARLIGYVPSNTAASGNAIYLGVDDQNITASGRPSVRLQSTTAFGMGTLLIADIEHAPSGCGIWPALWTLGAQGVWPSSGEIDIMEVVNGGAINSVTLHTGPNCAIANASESGHQQSFTGTVLTDNCDINAPGQSTNQGCSITAPPALASAGAPFNTAGGGVYATLWTAEGISVWFFPRANAASWPQSLLSDTPDPETFGVPTARFAGEGCDWASTFGPQNVILDTTFCGAWAGEVWASGGCAAQTGVATCDEYVANHPEAMSEAFWVINGLRVYTKQTAAVMGKLRRRAKRFVA